MELAEGPVSFRNCNNKVKHPFVIYADFESTLEKIHTVNPAPAASYTLASQQHVPNSWCCYTQCDEVDKLSQIKTYYGKHTGKKFVEYIQSEAHRLYKLLQRNVKINMSKDDLENYSLAKECYLCEEAFEVKQEPRKVRDHNHLTGKYGGAAHSNCNFKARYP